MKWATSFKVYRFSCKMLSEKSNFRRNVIKYLKKQFVILIVKLVIIIAKAIAIKTSKCDYSFNTTLLGHYFIIRKNIYRNEEFSNITIFHTNFSIHHTSALT